MDGGRQGVPRESATEGNETSVRTEMCNLRHYEDKLQELGLSTLEERRHQADMCMVHKIMHKKGDLQPDTGLRLDDSFSAYE
jgi:hypothetical protein